MLRSYCGVPGSGKTLNATYQAIKHYRRENNEIKYFISFIFSKIGIKSKKIDFDYYKRFPHHRIIYIYSNYPILLDKKRNIYSNKVTLWDLNNDYSFLPNSLIIIDEIQLYADSDEYKDKIVNKKLGKIAKFLQAHRHFGVKEIIFISQHPSRIFKKGRNICESYLKLRKIINIPFTPYSLILGTGYYEMEFYGRFIPKNREEKKKLPFDYYRFFRIFNRYKVYNAYDSRYLSNYNYNKPLSESGLYEGLKIDYSYLSELFDEQ